MGDNEAGEGNKLIAIFMGAKLVSLEEVNRICKTNYTKANRPEDTKEWIIFPSDIVPGIDRDTKFKNLKYHKSWDWLMPVLEKIKNTARVMYQTDLTQDFIVFEIDVWDNIVTIVDEGTGTYPICNPIKKGTLIEAIYQSVVEFIKWHNNIQNISK